MYFYWYNTQNLNVNFSWTGVYCRGGKVAGNCSAGYLCVGGQDRPDPPDSLCPYGFYCPEGRFYQVNLMPDRVCICSCPFSWIQFGIWYSLDDHLIVYNNQVPPPPSLVLLRSSLTRREQWVLESVGTVQEGDSVPGVPPPSPVTPAPTVWLVMRGTPTPARYWPTMTGRGLTPVTGACPAQEDTCVPSVTWQPTNCTRVPSECTAPMLQMSPTSVQ